MREKRKIPAWIPYPTSCTIKGKVLKIEYQGGVFADELKNIHSIMFYGALVPLSEEFISSVTQFSIPVGFHRRNMSKMTWITPSITTSKDDVLTKQILIRMNEKKCNYIVKRLLDAKFKSMLWLVPYPMGFSNRILDVEEMRNIEAMHAKRYWSKYYNKLGFGEYSRRGAKSINTVSATLNAVSKFVHGILLRWIMYHNFSPYHGFLHKPVEYPSLVYDLMEPYRGYLDKVVFDYIKDAQEKGVDQKNYLAWTIEAIKEFLDSKIYTPETRQIVTFHELLHGIVLALLSYVRKDTKRFVVPKPGYPNGGRPIKTAYKLYGRSGGPTNFWDEAQKVAENAII